MASDYPRSNCCIAGCPRWSRRFPGEWLCVDHWRLVSPRVKRCLRRAWKRLKDSPTEALCRVEQRLWERARREVVMRIAGL